MPGRVLAVPAAPVLDQELQAQEFGQRGQRRPGAARGEDPRLEELRDAILNVRRAVEGKGRDGAGDDEDEEGDGDGEGGAGWRPRSAVSPVWQRFATRARLAGSLTPQPPLHPQRQAGEAGEE